MAKRFEDAAAGQSVSSDSIGSLAATSAMANPGLSTVKILTASKARQLWNQFGNSMASAGFKKFSDFEGIQADAAARLADAARRGGAPAVRATDYIMRQTDEKYRKKMMENKEQQSKQQ